jgi:hypothetical protein
MATFTDASNDVWVFMPGRGNQAAPCTRQNGVAAVTVTRTGSSASATLRWCVSGTGDASMSISSHGTADAILWVADRTSLRAFDVAAGGTMLYASAGADAPPSLRHWLPPLVIDGRVYVVAGPDHANLDPAPEIGAQILAYTTH